MIQLIIAACMATSGECREFSLLYDAREFSQLTCMTRAQPQIARWQEEHPKWRVRRWHCDLHQPGSVTL